MYSSLDQGETGAVTLDGYLALHQHTCFLTWLSVNPVQTFSIPWLRPHMEASRQVEMTTNVLSHWGEQAGRWGWGKVKSRAKKRELHECFKIYTRRTASRYFCGYQPEKSRHLNKSRICSPAPLPPLPIPRLCQNKLKSYKDLWLKEQAPKHLWILPKGAPARVMD